TGQVSVKHIDAGIVRRHAGAAEPRLSKGFQPRPGEELVGLGLAFQCLVLQLHVVPRRDRQDGAREGAPLSRIRTGRLTAKLPPMEWPPLTMFSGRQPWVSSH